MNDTPEYPGWTHKASGKVRELYAPSDGSHDALLLVASDRISAFDYLLEPPITGKGALLTQLSRWWFDHLDVPNHVLDRPAPEAVADRAMVVKTLDMYPIECVVRGAITGSGFAEYQEHGSVCGVYLPQNLQDGDILDAPIYTPAYKAPQGEHDENISFDQTIELVGASVADQLRDTSLQIFEQARDRAAERGVILADTKFEFGADPATGELVLADEVLTSDSSRYWDPEVYAANDGAARLESFDKQIVRNWLLENWDRDELPPKLPQEIVERTLGRYRELYRRITGEDA
ncbi:MAG: phosphoribosylaminoimidazolesuccinocarboxamide synthase [Canibacter sp.]